MPEPQEEDSSYDLEKSSVDSNDREDQTGKNKQMWVSFDYDAYQNNQKKSPAKPPESKGIFNLKIDNAQQQRKPKY
jgi:hypothetical protein